MISAYTPPCRNTRTLKILNRFQWRWLLSTASSGWNIEKIDTFLDLKKGYSIDNGAYPDFIHNRPFQIKKYLRLLELYGSQADWIVIPDMVSKKKETIDLAKKWIPKLPYRKLFVVQDGMIPADVEIFKKEITGIFVGGSTEWKLDTMPIWCSWGIKNKKLVHVGRVNSVKRIKLCIEFGATSFDGSGYSRFKDKAISCSNFLNIHKRQIKLFDNL